VWCRATRVFFTKASTRRGNRSGATRPAFMHGSSSTSATICSGSSIRCGCAISASSATRTSCFRTPQQRRSERLASLHPQLIVQRGLDLQERLLVVKARAVDQENVL